MVMPFARIRQTGPASCITSRGRGPPHSVGASGLGALAAIQHVQGQLRGLERAHGVRQARAEVDDVAGLEHNGATVGLDLEGALEGVQDDGHRGGVLAEDLVLVEAEEDQAHALCVHDGARHRGFLVDLDHRGDVLQVRHDGRGDLGVRFGRQAH